MHIWERIMLEIKIFLMRNKIQLCYPKLPVIENTVNLNYCHAELKKGETNSADSGVHNLGDDLSPVVVQYMLQREGLSLDSPTSKTHHLCAVGSILFFGYQNATVWGSGLLEEPSFIRGLTHSRIFRKLDIRCVRGPYTQAALRKIGFDCPAVYGDPGCLLPLIYYPKVEKSVDYLVIPYFTMEDELKGIVPSENIISMMTADYKAVIDKICSAKKVISSSLHGIILAEAYGVPTVFYQDRPSSLNFKYADWYESTGRKQWPTTTNLQEAINMDVDFVPDLSEMQNRLIDCFPYDLWKK